MNEERAWHRETAVRLFNDTWVLIDRPDRSADEAAEMLLAAAASRWHWGEVGGVEEVASGDWQLAHVAALLALPDLAAMFARRNLATAEREGWTGWRLASAHEGMARACAASGDAAGRQHHAAAALDALEQEPDPEDRQIVADQLATIPEA